MVWVMRPQQQGVSGTYEGGITPLREDLVWWLVMIYQFAAVILGRSTKPFAARGVLEYHAAIAPSMSKVHEFEIR